MSDNVSPPSSQGMPFQFNSTQLHTKTRKNCWTGEYLHITYAPTIKLLCLIFYFPSPPQQMLLLIRKPWFLFLSYPCRLLQGDSRDMMTVGRKYVSMHYPQERQDAPAPVLIPLHSPFNAGYPITWKQLKDLFSALEQSHTQITYRIQF